MIDIKEESLVNVAEDILSKSDEPIDLYDLFQKVIDKKGVEKTDADMINRFYSELVSSAKFVYTGDNTWDLKANQKIDLWDKDGSYYNEYKEVHDSDLDEKIRKEIEAEKAHQAMLEKRLQAEEEAEKAQENADAEAVVPDDEVLVDEEEERIEAVEEGTLDEDLSDLGEEDLEGLDEEDLDEEEYEKYMDQYEDMYDDD
ncbi:MAG: DNA-directed RNA polymerase subunit delta [Candidatus Izemoplasmataceae bacterium]